MGIWTLLIMLLFVFQVKYAEAQVSAVFDVRNASITYHGLPTGANGYTMHAATVSPALSPRVIGLPKTSFLLLSHYKNTEWSTFSLRNNSGNPGNNWLNEHNLVVVKSVMQIVNRLVVGINCHYNWCFIIAGNGAGMMLNKLPIKIYFAGAVGDVPNLCHR